MQAAIQAARVAGLGEAVDQAERLRETAGCLSSCQCCAGCVDSSFFGCIADVMDNCSEAGECVGSVVGLFASPVAFPLVYCFPAEGDLGAPWDVSMEEAPVRQPAVCCCFFCCPCLVQHWVRRRVLDGDMSRYKCFQGLRDGPHCLARCSPSLPFHFQAGTYGEQDCPTLCLCAETTCCTMCAFQASRELQRSERGLGLDPTEVKVSRCLEVFGQIASFLCCAGCWIKCVGCLVGCCLGQVDGAREFDDSSQRLGNSCQNIAHGIWRGMRWVITIATACMSAQMVHESYLPIAHGGTGAQTIGAPKQEQMTHGFGGSRA